MSLDGTGLSTPLWGVRVFEIIQKTLELVIHCGGYDGKGFNCRSRRSRRCDSA
jgi:hypothetical protein